jgi:hypothetical protein
VRRENGLRIDSDEIKRLADSKTNLILVNRPHNPTGATIGDGEMEALHDFIAERGMRRVSGEVLPSHLPGKANEIGGAPAARHRDRRPVEGIFDCRSVHGMDDRAQCPALPAILDRARLLLDLQHHHRRNSFGNRNRKRDVVLSKTQEAATRNLKPLERFMADHRDVLGWIPPQGGMTAFPWLVSGENDRPFCQAATERGILLAPCDCFDAPSHFRLGFAAAGDNFSRRSTASGHS